MLKIYVNYYNEYVVEIIIIKRVQLSSHSRVGVYYLNNKDLDKGNTTMVFIRMDFSKEKQHKMMKYDLALKDEK